MKLISFFKQHTLIKNMLLLTIVISIFISIAASCSKNEPPILIGAALMLSGPTIYIGEEVRDGLLMAAEDINAQGGVNGREIEVIIKNAAASDKETSKNDKIQSEDPAKKAFEELETSDPLLIVSCLSQLSMKLATIAEEKKRLLVGLVATIPELTIGKDWVYRYWTTAEYEAPPITEIFFRFGGTGNLGVIYLDDAYGGSVFKDTLKRCQEKNIQVVPSPFPLDAKDYKNNLNAVKDTDAVVIIGFDFHIINIIKALRSINYKGEIISTTTATLPSVVATPEANGVHVTAPALYNKNYPFADAVKKRYLDRYKKPFTQYSANGYDFLIILAGLLEDKPINKESVKAIFDKGFVYSGLFGNIELKKGGKDILFPLFPAQIRNGEINYR